MKHPLTILVIAICATGNLFAQSEQVKILTFEEYLNLVRTNHPMARQADLQQDMGDAYLLKARGSFDPKLYGDYNQKFFDGKDYYRLLDAGLKVPTWFGLEAKAGYEQNQGSFVNDQNNNPPAGLAYLGLSLPIGRGLFIDQRRADLRQAQIYQESTLVQRQKMYNDLIYEAGKAYWDWFFASNLVPIFENAVDATVEQFQNVKRSAELGDKASIDTLESGIYVQNQQLNLQQSRLDFANAKAQLSVFLWADGVVPLELNDQTVPPLLPDDFPLSDGQILLGQLDTLIASHPELLTTQFKIEQLEVEQRLKRENLKPQFNLNYNAINEPIGGDPIQNYTINDYTWGVEFNMPLLLRKERGDLRLANAKIESASFGLQTKNVSLYNKALMAINEMGTTRSQFLLYSQTVKDYNGLLNGEQQKFEAGESSLFIVNHRLMGYIGAQTKLVELFTKNQKAELKAGYSLGVLGRETQQ